MSGDRPLRIEMVVPAMVAAGMETVVAQLARGLVRRGHEVGVTCIEFTGILGEKLADEGYRVTVVPTPGLLTNWFPAPLESWFGEIRPDVVHTHNGVWLKAARAARRTAGTPVVNTVHGIEVTEPWYFSLYSQLALRYTDRLVAVSDSLRDFLVRRFHLAAAGVEVILNGVDIERFRPADPPPSNGARDVVIGHVARLDVVKNQKLLIDAFALVHARFPRTKLVIAGDGPLRSELEAHAAGKRLGAAVEFLGHIADVAPLYRTFDQFVLSSSIEGTSISILEAMASGLGVIATAVGGNAGLLGTAGILVPPDDPDAMAEAMASLIRDRASRDSLGRTARQWIEDNASETAMLNRYEALYYDCVGRHPAAAATRARVGT